MSGFDGLMEEISESFLCGFFFFFFLLFEVTVKRQL